MNNIKITCEACGSKNLRDYIICENPININYLTSSNFKVTSKEYSSCIETVKCLDCNLIQTKYNLNPQDLVKFYSGVIDNDYLESAEIRGESNYNQVIKLIRKFKPDAQSIFEIGAGSGTMLNLLKNEFEINGIEPSESFCKFAKDNYEIELSPLGYESYKSSKKYDVIIALDVIEHVVSPSNLLKNMGEMLNEDGIVIIGTPNIESISANLLRKKWYHIRPPHIYFFSPKTFYLLSRNNSFNIVKEYYFSWSFPLYYLVDALQKLILKRSIFNFNFLKFKVKINLFDSKVYVIRKRI